MSISSRLHSLFHGQPAAATPTASPTKNASNFAPPIPLSTTDRAVAQKVAEALNRRGPGATPRERSSLQLSTAAALGKGVDRRIHGFLAAPRSVALQASGKNTSPAALVGAMIDHDVGLILDLTSQAAERGLDPLRHAGQRKLPNKHTLQVQSQEVARDSLLPADAEQSRLTASLLLGKQQVAHVRRDGQGARQEMTLVRLARDDAHLSSNDLLKLAAFVNQFQRQHPEKTLVIRCDDGLSHARQVACMAATYREIHRENARLPLDPHSNADRLTQFFGFDIRDLGRIALPSKEQLATLNQACGQLSVLRDQTMDQIGSARSRPSNPTPETSTVPLRLAHRRPPVSSPTSSVAATASTASTSLASSASSALAAPVASSAPAVSTPSAASPVPPAPPLPPSRANGAIPAAPPLPHSGFRGAPSSPDKSPLVQPHGASVEPQPRAAEDAPSRPSSGTNSSTLMSELGDRLRARRSGIDPDHPAPVKRVTWAGEALPASSTRGLTTAPEAPALPPKFASAPRLAPRPSQDSPTTAPGPSRITADDLKQEIRRRAASRQAAPAQDARAPTSHTRVELRTLPGRRGGETAASPGGSPTSTVYAAPWSSTNTLMRQLQEKFAELAAKRGADPASPRDVAPTGSDRAWRTAPRVALKPTQAGSTSSSGSKVAPPKPPRAKLTSAPSTLIKSPPPVAPKPVRSALLSSPVDNVRTPPPLPPKPPRGTL